jgi:hypothetical protein
MSHYVVSPLSTRISADGVLPDRPPPSQPPARLASSAVVRLGMRDRKLNTPSPMGRFRTADQITAVYAKARGIRWVRLAVVNSIPTGRRFRPSARGGSFRGRSAQRKRGRRRGPGPLLVASAGFRLLRRPRRHAGPRRGRRRDGARAAGGQRQPGRGLRHEHPGREDPRGGRGQGGPVPGLRAPRGDLWAQHDHAQLRAVPDRRPRVQPGRRDPRLVSGPRRGRRALAGDRARPRSRGAARRTPRRHDPGLRGPGAQARTADQGGRVRLGLQRGRHDHRRVPRVRPRAPGRGPRLGGRRPLRGARADRRPRHRCRRADLLPVQVLRPASRRRLRAHRGDRAMAALQGPAGAHQPAGAQLRDRHAAVRAARRVQRDHRLPRLDRGLRRDRPLRALAGPAVPGRPVRRGHRLRAARDGRSRADVPGQRGRRGRRGCGCAPGDRADRGLGARFVVLARPVPEPRLHRQVGPDRLRPLQHHRRGRPPARGAGPDRPVIPKPP